MLKRSLASGISSIVLICSGSSFWAASGDISPAHLEFFEKKIRPVLVDRCLTCHSEQQPLAGLRLDSRRGWEKGGNSGSAIVPGDPDARPTRWWPGTPAVFPTFDGLVGPSYLHQLSVLEIWSLAATLE